MRLSPDAIYSDGLDALNEALSKISAHGDVSQVSVLVESLGYFAGSARKGIVEVLRELTGLDHGTSESKWKEWLGNNLSEHEPPEGYAGWKAAVLALTDDRFADFLDDPDNTARIDLRESCTGASLPMASRTCRIPKQFRPVKPTTCLVTSGSSAYHKRRAPGVSAAHRQPARDGQRLLGR